METNKDDEQEYILKFIIIGDTCVGKSNLLLKYTDRNFNNRHDITIGVDYGVRRICYNNNLYKVQVWDTAGQETFRVITRSYYRNSLGCLLVYDVTNRVSFYNVSGWLDDVKKYSESDLEIILVGNKIDVTNKREVSVEEGQDMANKHNILFIETSAKTGEGVDEAYFNIIKLLDTKIKNGDIIPNVNKLITPTQPTYSYYCCY